MVYAFITHTLPPDTCRVLFSCTFGLEDVSDPEGHGGGDGDNSRRPIDELRIVRKEQMALVARQVQSEYSFQKAVSERLIQGDALSGQEDLLQDAEVGLVRLAAGDPFQTEKIAIWIGVGKAGFVLVCEPHENMLQAENQLRIVVRNLQEHVRAVRTPSEMLEKGDRVAAVVHHFLPSGRIIFMNHALIRQTEKELELAMKVK
ncbi:AP-5 complex subunit sigma-1-like [Diadema setosum]|uniref:AP-5 complex subunit sigma-1-like n=1 Tax=Diadema setosum TaxID=31175 RepID=UPI003B3B1D50